MGLINQQNSCYNIWYSIAYFMHFTSIFKCYTNFTLHYSHVSSNGFVSKPTHYIFCIKWDSIISLFVAPAFSIPSIFHSAVSSICNVRNVY